MPPRPAEVSEKYFRFCDIYHCVRAVMRLASNRLEAVRPHPTPASKQAPVGWERPGLLSACRDTITLASTGTLQFVVTGPGRQIVLGGRGRLWLAGASADDPNAPYKLYEGDKLIGTYWTRAEARREQQKLEGEAGSKPRQFAIKDKHGRIVL